MPRQTGLIQLVGTVGDLTYCRNGIVRARRRSDPEDFRHSPTRAPHRHNSAEFGVAAQAASQLRRALLTQLAPYRKQLVIGTFVGALRNVIKLDTTHPPGERQLLATHMAALRGQSFAAPTEWPTAYRQHAAAECRLAATPDPGRFVLTLPPLPPPARRSLPVGTTHYRAVIGLALLNLVTGTARPVELGAVSTPLPVDAPPAGALLLPGAMTSPAQATEVAIAVVGRGYFRLHAGQFEPLPTTATPFMLVHAPLTAS